MKNKVTQTLRTYDNVVLYIGFLAVAAFLAASRGCTQEFLTVVLYPFMIPVFLNIVMLVFSARRGANGRILLLVLIMLTLAGLMRAVYWTSYPDLYEGANLPVWDYFLTQIVIFAVMLIYPMQTQIKNKRVYEILSGRKFTLAMAVLIAVMYGMLLLFGVSYGGAKAWISVGGYLVQLTEPIKLLFIICLAAMMSRDEKTPLAILFYLVNAALMGVVVSELGTALVMTFVFFIFLFIFPQKKGVYFWLGVSAFVLMILMVMILRAVSSEYEYAMKQSDPRVFAARFTGTLYDYAMSTPEDVVTMDILREMVDNSLTSMKTEEQAELGRAFHSISKQITDGQLKLSDFADARDSEIWIQVAGVIDEKTEDGVGPETAKAVTAKIEKYPAVAAIARLCENPGFRSAYITRFCSSDYYITDTLYRSAAPGFWHSVNRKLWMGAYAKFIQRIVLPNEALSARFGFTSEVPYQLDQAQSAMRVGGLTGANRHEFYYIPVMESDMIFAEMVSLYGFGMGFFVILLYMILFREGMKETVKLKGKPFHRGLVLGITLMIFIQALIIIAGNLSLFPLTGITLPFIADGSLSMLVFGVMIGILLAASYVPIREDILPAGSADTMTKEDLKSLPGGLISTIRGNLWNRQHRDKKKRRNKQQDKTQKKMPEDETDTGGFPVDTAPPEEGTVSDTDKSDFPDNGKQGGGPDQNKKKQTKYTDWN